MPRCRVARKEEEEEEGKEDDDGEGDEEEKTRRKFRKKNRTQVPHKLEAPSARPTSRRSIARPAVHSSHARARIIIRIAPRATTTRRYSHHRYGRRPNVFQIFYCPQDARWTTGNVVAPSACTDRLSELSDR